MSLPADAMVGTLVVADASNSRTGASPASLIYEFGDGTSEAGTQLLTASHTYAEAGTYTVRLTITDANGQTDTLQRSIVIHPGAASLTPPTACFTAPSSALANDAISVDAACFIGPENTTLDYLFDFGDGTPMASGRVVSHRYDTPGAYRIALILTATWPDASTRQARMEAEITIEDRRVTISGITPDNGRVSGGEWVTVQGSGFGTATDTTVRLGGLDVLNLTVVDRHTLTFQTPPGIAGDADLQISTPYGTAVSPAVFTFLGGVNRADTQFCPDPATTTGSRLPFAAFDDDASHAIATPFAINLFDKYYTAGTTAYVSSNGTISLEDSTAPFANTDLPSPDAPRALIAPFFDDLNIGSGAVYSAVTGSAPNRRWTIEWYRILDQPSQQELLDFQATLYESSGDIKFQYYNPTVNGARSLGQSATIGLQLDAGTGVVASSNAAVQGLAPGGVAVVWAYDQGSYRSSVHKTLAVSSLSPADGALHPSQAPLRVTFSTPINSGTLATDTTVRLVDTTSGRLVSTRLTPVGDKSTVEIQPEDGLLFGHTYRLDVTSGVLDISGQMLSQDPMAFACGAAGNPTTFTSMLTADASLTFTSNGLPSGGGPEAVATFSVSGQSYVLIGKDSGRIQIYASQDLNNALSDNGMGTNDVFAAVADPTQPIVYASDFGNGDLLILDVSDPLNPVHINGSPIGLNVQNQPRGLALTSDGGTLFIADKKDVVHVVDTAARNEVQTTNLTGGCKGYDAAISNGKVYVTCDGDKLIEELSASTYALLNTINLGGNARTRGIAADPVQNRVYAANNNEGTVIVLDTSAQPATVVGTWKVPGVSPQPRQLAVTPDGLYLLVVDDANDTATIFRTSDGSVFSMLGGLNGPFDLDWLPGSQSAIISNNNNDTLAIIE